MKKTIKHLGKEVTTTHFCESVTHEECREIANDYRDFQDHDTVDREFTKLTKGGVKISAINKYYMSDAQRDVVLYTSRWSINEMLGSDDLIRHAVARIINSPKVFPIKYSISKNLDTFFRVGGAGYAQKPTNFKIKVVRDILEKYNINNNYYDFSCGWGVRMMGAMSIGVNYFGTDPNTKLVPRLNELKEDFADIANIGSTVDIRCQGSETFIPEWENTMGVAFSSPPYFNLEDYRNGDQSCDTSTNYDQWVSDYLEPTIKNIFSYLVDDGKMIVNINNFKKFDLVGDTIKIAERNGFKLASTTEYENSSRITTTGKKTNNNEGMYIFNKIK